MQQIHTLLECIHLRRELSDVDGLDTREDGGDDWVEHDDEAGADV